MPMRPAVLLMLLLLVGPLFLHAANPTPTATPDPRQQMLQEIGALRTTQAVAQITEVAPLNEVEIVAHRKIFEDLIARFPTEAEPHVVYGEFLIVQVGNEAAFQQWTAALTLDPARHDVLAAQADILLQTGQIVAAADALEKAATLAPTNASYPYSLAHVYTLFRRDLIASRHLTEEELITRGTAYFRRAAELAPDNLSYARAYAEAFYTQPQPDWTIARAAWESLLARSPEKSFIHSHLVRINIRLHDKAAAARHLAALTDPAFGTLREKLQKQVDAL